MIREEDERSFLPRSWLVEVDSDSRKRKRTVFVRKGKTPGALPFPPGHTPGQKERKPPGAPAQTLFNTAGGQSTPPHASLTVLAMGNLLRALSRLEGAPGSDCYGRGGADPRDPRDVFVDFEDARPRARGEAAVYGRAEEVIALADDVLASLRQYKGEERVDFHRLT